MPAVLGSLPNYYPISEEKFRSVYRSLSNFIGENIAARPKVIGQSEEQVYSQLQQKFQDLHEDNKNLFVLNEKNKKTFLHKASAEENIPLIRFLKWTGHDMDRQDRYHKTPLYDACFHQAVESVKLLCSYNANPNIGGAYGENTPLLAIIESDTVDKKIEADITKELVAAAADLNWQTEADGFSPLQLSILHSKKEVAEEILYSGQADPKHIDKQGQTALHMVAAYRDKDELERELPQMWEEREMAASLLFPLDIIAMQDQLGNTPLHCAVIHGNVYVAEYLLEYDYLFPQMKILKIQNKEGMTAIHEAVREAKRGTKLLELFMRLATEEDLAIKNTYDETVTEMADRLMKEVPLSTVSAENLEIAANNLALTAENLRNLENADRGAQSSWRHNLATEAENLFKAVAHLGNNRISDYPSYSDAINPDAIFKKAVELHRDAQSLNERNYRVLASEANDLSESTKQLAATTKDFFDQSYVDALDNVQHILKQTDFLAWKDEKLSLPGSFPDLETVDANHYRDHAEEHYSAATLAYNQGYSDYSNGVNEEAIKNLKTSVSLYEQYYPGHRSFANAHWLLGMAYLAEGDNAQAQRHIKASIEVYYTLKDYASLETAFQSLGNTYLNSRKASQYEVEMQNVLKGLATPKEKLFAHLALAGLYNQIKEKNFSLSPDRLSYEDLETRESYHYSEVYKATQGPADNQAHVVLQREMGVGDNLKLGTYNIQQCVVAVVYDPITKKVVLSHFDRFSGPLKFIKQITAQFPADTKLDIYLSGGRDRLNGKQTSDSNINQVLKQIYAYKERFTVKSTDLGDKVSPEAIVFDVDSARLVHRMPNCPDSSLDSRVVKMGLQICKSEYMRPLNIEDFALGDEGRQKIFNLQEQETIRNYKYTSFGYQTAAWRNNQLLFPFKMVGKEITQQPHDFNRPLLTHFYDGFSLAHYPTLFNFDLSFLSQQNVPQSTDLLDVLLAQASNNLADLGGEPIDISQIDFDSQDKFDDIDLGPVTKKFKACSNRRKREANSCSFRKAIDEMNVVEDKNLIEKINLDSTKLLRYLKGADEVARTEVLTFASTCIISGKDQAAVRRLIYIEGKKPTLKLVSSVSSGLMQGMMAKDTLAALLKGDGKTVAINLGFIGASHGLGKLSELVVSKGTSLLAAGETLLGKSLFISTPFLARSTSVFIAFDLVSQIKALESGDKDAIAGVVGDSITLGVDLMSIGVEIAEITEVVAGISSVTGPAGEAIGAVVMLGVQIYQAVRAVDRLDALVRLSGWEKFKEGWRAFLGMQPEAYIQQMTDLVAEYGRVLAEKNKFLQAHPLIKNYVFSAIEQIITDCHTVKTSLGDECVSDGVGVFCYPAYEEREVCNVTFPAIKDNAAGFLSKETGFTLARAKPINPQGSQFICLPMGDDGESVPAEGAYVCDAALGLTNRNNSLGKITLIDLGEGEDIAVGFDDHANFFRVGNGRKHFYGGGDEDIFIVEAEEVEGALVGSGGVDTLELSGFQPKAGEIIINFPEGELQYGNKTVYISGLEKLYGSASQIYSVIAACETQAIDTQGGLNAEKPDRILIPGNGDCHYSMSIRLESNIDLINQAEVGNFTYFVQPDQGVVSVQLPLSSVGTSHQFIINSTMADLSVISVNSSASDDPVLAKQAIKLHFLSHNSSVTEPPGFKLDITSISANNTIFSFQEGAELKVGDKNIYLLHNSNETIAQIIDSYSALAQRLNVTCLIQKTLENESVTIAYGKHKVLHNDPLAAKSHLVGNGGENLFVIHSGVSPFALWSLPLAEVILYQRGEDSYTDSLDLRALTTQVATRLNRTITLLFIPPNAENRAGNDLLLLLSLNAVRSLSSRVIELMTIRLKDALLDDWFRNLHVILHTAPMRIVGSVSNLRLQAIPLEFSAKYKLISIGANDVEAETEILIHRKFERHLFFRDGDNLLLTNTLSFSQVKPNTILLANFYKEPKLATLSINFSNKKIVLNEFLAEINAAADFNQTRIQQTKVLYDIAFNDSNTVNRANVSVVERFRKRRAIFELRPAVMSHAASSHANGILNMGHAIKEVTAWMEKLFYGDKTKELAYEGLDKKLSFSKAKPMVKGGARNKLCNKRLFSLETALSENVKKPVAWWSKLPLDGAIMGVSNAVFDKVTQSRGDQVLPLILFRTFLDMCVISSSYALSSTENAWNNDEVASSIATSFFATIGLTVTLRSIGMGLEYSDRPFAKQVKKGMQALCCTFLLYAMFNFFVSDESNQEKLETTLNWLYHSGLVIAADKATRTVLNSKFFNSVVTKDNVRENQNHDDVALSRHQR